MTIFKTFANLRHLQNKARDPLCKVFSFSYSRIVPWSLFVAPVCCLKPDCLFLGSVQQIGCYWGRFNSHDRHRWRFSPDLCNLPPNYMVMMKLTIMIRLTTMMRLMLMIMVIRSLHSSNCQRLLPSLLA